jgi:hypothetical protein
MSEASDRRILQGRIRRLELLLRLSTGDRARDIRQALDQLYEQVGKAEVRPDPKKLLADAPASAAGVNGVGGLTFTANAPPGIGRIVAIPLYLYELDNQPSFPAGALGTSWSTVTTASGVLAPDETSPTVLVNIPPLQADGITPNRKVTGLRFRTPILEWATVRIVGFQVSTKAAPLPEFPEDLPGAGIVALPGIPNGGAFANADTLPEPYTTNQRPLLLVRNLNVGGSANLFPQGEHVDATVYSTLLPEYAGLRDNPILASPNRAYLSASVVGVPYTSLTFSMQIIVDILDDTEFGAHRPGPYARRGAQGRVPSVEHVSYVTR